MYPNTQCLFHYCWCQGGHVFTAICVSVNSLVSIMVENQCRLKTTDTAPAQQLMAHWLVTKKQV